MNTFIERILSRAKSLPEVWQRIDAMTEPGPDASPAARLHHAALKMLRALSLLAGCRIDQPPTSPFSVDSLHWTHAQHFWLRLSPYVSVGPAHDAVLCLTDVFGGAHTYADGFDASVPHTNDEWADAMVPVPPCEVPSERELLSMAKACIREHGAHWDQLTPKQQDAVRLLHEEGVAMSYDALGKAGLNWSRRFWAEVQAPLEQLGIIAVDREHRPVLHSLRCLPLGFPR